MLVKVASKILNQAGFLANLDLTLFITSSNHSYMYSKSLLYGKYAFLKFLPQIEITVYRTHYNM